MSEPQNGVPKFSRLKVKLPAKQPEQSPAPPTAVKRQRSPESHHRSIKRHRSPEFDDTTRHSRRRDDDRKGHHSRRQERRHQSREPTRREESVPPASSPSHYTIDTRGDPQNVAYQRLHKYIIPPYHRLGYGNILGLSLRLKIDQHESSDDKIYLIDKALAPKDRPQRLLLKRQKVQDVPLARPQIDAALDPTHDYIALTPDAQHRRLSTSSDEDSNHYRDINRPKFHAKAPPLSDDNPQPTFDPDLEARKTNAQLHRTTKLDPTNLQAWLDLVAHQQYLVRPGVDALSLTNHERQTLADMRIAIYDKALKHIPATDASSRERLLLNQLQEASLVWDSQKYLKSLQHVLQRYPTSFPIWTKYLAAVQTDPTGFRFEDAKPFFLRCLGNVKTNADPGNASDAQAMTLYLVLRYTAFLLDTGYDELSIAIWQALFEYQFFKPAHLADVDDDLVFASFEDFWESESPRFGEIGAQGWRAYSSDDTVHPGTQQSATRAELSSKMPFRRFARLEKEVAASSRFPGRTMDEHNLDDPFHIVFFADIKEVIKAVSESFDRRALIDSFLCFLGLSQLHTTSNPYDHRVSRDWRSDIFLDHGLLKIDSGCGLEGCHVQQYQMSPDILFSRAFADASLRDPTDAASEQGAVEESVLFAKRALASLVQLSSKDEALAEYYLAFLLRFFPNEASKSAKSILKKNPSSLRLYNACAMVETRLGRVEKAGQIWSGAISMKESFSPETQQDLVLLWRNWVWCDLETSQHRRALSHLLSFGGKTDPQTDAAVTVSTAALLRIRRAFKDGFEHALSQSKPYLATLNAELLALTAYLTESDGLQASIKVLEDYCNIATQASSTSQGRKNTVLLEFMHQAKIGIFAQHIRSKRPYKPAFIRSELESSIALFPNNTIFLELYRDNEARFRIDDRVRSILKSKVLIDDQTPLVGWAFAIDQEISRYMTLASGSTAESVRATFNRALLTTGSPVKHSKTLWTKWFQFEAHVVSKEASVSRPLRKRSLPEHPSFQKLKQTFLSGLYHLPWSKDWVLLGLEAFDTEDGSGWDVRELRRLYNVLVERELRIRVEGLEDMLDSMEE